MGAGSVEYFQDDAKTRIGLKPYPYVITTLPYGLQRHIVSDLVPDSPDGTQKVLVSLQWRPPGAAQRIVGIYFNIRSI